MASVVRSNGDLASVQCRWHEFLGADDFIDIVTKVMSLIFLREMRDSSHSVRDMGIER